MLSFVCPLRPSFRVMGVSPKAGSWLDRFQPRNGRRIDGDLLREAGIRSPRWLTRWPARAGTPTRR